MKRLLKYLFLILVILLPFNIKADTTSTSGYELLIDDKASLLTEEEKIKLEDAMTPLLEYGNIAFATNNTLSNSTTYQAMDFYHDYFGYESGTVFYIDLKNREIYIFSEGNNSDAITNMKSNVITDNVYTYASSGDYYECAKVAFEQMLTVLEGGKIAEPLRFICSIIIGLILSFMICFIYAYLSSRKKKASTKSLMNSVDSNIIIKDFNAEITGERRVYNPPSDSSSSSGGGGGGGGGGSSGSGGGHRF